MQGRDSPMGDGSKKWKMELIDMEVENVEFFGAVADAIEHQHVIGDGIANILVETEGPRGAGDQIGTRYGVAACEQRYVVT